MSASLFAYLDNAPSFDEFAAEALRLGLQYRYSLPPDRRWRYPLHVFGLGDLRVVYHQGNPAASKAVVNTTVRRGDSPIGAVQLRLISQRVVRRWGGEIYDPQIRKRVTRA